MRNTIMVLILLLVVKHLIFDVAVDGHNKLMHTTYHGVSTMMVLLMVAPISVPLTMVLGAFDSGVHYIVDKVKLVAFQNKYKYNHTVTRTEYWTLTILDQTLHTITYAIIVLVVSWTMRKEVMYVFR